jgi:hypothetical protein
MEIMDEMGACGTTKKAMATLAEGGRTSDMKKVLQLFNELMVAAKGEVRLWAEGVGRGRRGDSGPGEQAGGPQRAERAIIRGYSRRGVVGRRVKGQCAPAVGVRCTSSASGVRGTTVALREGHALETGGLKVARGRE